MGRTTCLRDRAALVLAAAGIVCVGGGGCVAFNVGRPETFQVEVPVGEETRTTGREVLFGQVLAETHGDGDGGTVGVEFSLHGMVDRTEQKGRKVNVVDVTRQKRLSFGLFPGTAEWIFRPEGWAVPDGAPSGMTPEQQEELIAMRYRAHWGDWGDSVRANSLQVPEACLPFVGMLAVGLGLGVGALYTTPLTPYFLFVEPVAGHWTCQSHMCWIDLSKGQSGSLRYWEANGEGHFRKVDPSMIREKLVAFVHCIPLGFFRHSFVKFSEEREGEWSPRGSARHMREAVAAKGPYRVEVRIPALGYADSRVAWRGAETVRFDVPRGQVPGETVALVKFRAEGAVADESQRALLEDAEKWTQVVPLWLPGPEGANVRVVVEGARTRGAPLRYAKERDMGNGGTRWVVEILDESLEALDVAAFARPLILDELRTGWLERHPEEDAGSVGAWADWKTGENERTLVFAGAAFSARPVAEGWRYDAATRRGEVRWAVTEDADAETMRRWARENVESIARDRAAVLKAGEAAPEGGRYRSLSEQLEGGVLILEFEVVQ